LYVEVDLENLDANSLDDVGSKHESHSTRFNPWNTFGEGPNRGGVRMPNGDCKTIACGVACRKF
jgi:hypothetical protein